MIFKNSLSASWLVRELSSPRLDWPRIGLSANSPVSFTVIGCGFGWYALINGLMSPVTSSIFHSVNSSSHHTDIAMRWEWPKFDPSENPKPLTDYDTTLHNWLCPRDEHVTHNLCQSVVRECLANYVKYKASSFLFYFIFSQTRLLK